MFEWPTRFVRDAMNRPPSTVSGPGRAVRRPLPHAPHSSDSKRAKDRKGTVRAIFAGIGSNVAIAIAKGIGAWFSGSGALLAEALHSLSDTGNGILLLLGQREAKEPATPDHPLGKGRATYFWSFVVALLLFTGSGVVSVYEGIGKLRSGGDLDSPLVAIGVLGFAFVAEGISQLVTLRSIKRRRGRFTLWQWLRNTRHSELIVTFAEDAAALVGIAIALAAVIATWVTGNEAYDASGSIAIGVLLIVVAIGLSIEIKSLLIGESAAPPVREEMRAFLAGRREIVSVAHLITSQHGDDLIVAIKARMDPALDAKGVVAAIAACEKELATKFPQVTWVFFEPVS